MILTVGAIRFVLKLIWNMNRTTGGAGIRPAYGVHAPKPIIYKKTQKNKFKFNK
ncbi:hypothetical protein FACS1894132_03950 [Clostridia bacterium]|nr:hypothetical protein FACS1894132_03950 [Clostridia bacterium]